MADFTVYTAQDAVEHLRRLGRFTKEPPIVLYLLALDIIEAEGGVPDFSPNEFIVACAESAIDTKH